MSNGAFDVMRGQAGNRLIVAWKIKDRDYSKTSHFANLDEFFARIEWLGDELDWYAVNGGEKVKL